MYSRYIFKGFYKCLKIIKILISVHSRLLNVNDYNYKRVCIVNRYNNYYCYVDV